MSTVHDLLLQHELLVNSLHRFVSLCEKINTQPTEYSSTDSLFTKASWWVSLLSDFDDGLTHLKNMGKSTSTSTDDTVDASTVDATTSTDATSTDTTVVASDTTSTDTTSTDTTSTDTTSTDTTSTTSPLQLLR